MHTVYPDTFELTANNLDDFIARTMHLIPDETSAVSLDLRKLNFIDLFAMTSIAYLCRDLATKLACRVRLVLGESQAGHFLPRAGFFDILPPEVELEAEYSTTRIEYMRLFRGANSGLLELTHIDSSTTIDDILDKFIHILRRQLKYPRNDAFDLAIMLSELCHNVLDHNAVSAHGVSAMQVYDGKAAGFMQIVVGDRGAGIRASLQRNPAYADLVSDVDAIRRSVELGVSEHEDCTRGNGLYHLLELAHKHHGAVHIRSGSGKVYFRMDRRLYHVFMVPELRGTQFSITFPAKTRG